VNVLTDFGRVEDLGITKTMNKTQPRYQQPGMAFISLSLKVSAALLACCISGTVVAGQYKAGGLHRQRMRTAVSSVTFDITGVEGKKGQVVLSVFGKAEGFPNSGAIVVKKIKLNGLKVTDPLAVVIKGLPRGLYAVSVFQDLNMNSRADSDSFHIPQEPWGLSNDPKLPGKPRFEEAQFELKGSGRTISIPLHRPSTATEDKGQNMSEFQITVDYPYSQLKVWKALTDPMLIPYWTSTGQGARAVGFDTKVGTKFQYVAKPMFGWDGIVNCEVVECIDNSLLEYTWQGGDDEAPQLVTCKLEHHGNGTRLTWEHKGFRGVRGTMMSKILKTVREKMLREGMPSVLRDLDDQGKPIPGSELEKHLATGNAK